MNRIILIVVCLLAAVPALGTGMFGGPPEPGKMPTRFVRLDCIDVGTWLTRDVYVGPFPIVGNLMKVTVVLNRVRFGASYAHEFSVFDWWSGGMTVPVHVGYTFYSVPRKSCIFWSNVADVYLEASGSLLASPGLRVALCLDNEYYGLGTRFEFGWATIHASGNLGPGPWQEDTRISFIYAGLQLRFVTFGIGF